jgi:hypothetical protein
MGGSSVFAFIQIFSWFSLVLISILSYLFARGVSCPIASHKIFDWYNTVTDWKRTSSNKV